MDDDLTEEQSIETAWKIHASIGDWTARADAKATFALTIETALLALIVAFAGSGHLSGLQGILVTFSGAMLAASILASALVVYPSLRSSALKAEVPANFIYFGHIKQMTEAQVVAQIKGDQLLAALARQLKVTADIAWEKHRRVQTSLIAAGIGAVLAAVAVLAG